MSAVAGLKIVGGEHKATDPADRGNLAKIVEAVESDYNDMSNRVASLEGKKPFAGDLGEADNNTDATGLSDGIYTYTEGGTKKVGAVTGGKFIPLG